MTEPGGESTSGVVGAAFREGFVEADAFRIKYMEAGEGAPLLHLRGAGGLRLTRGLNLLRRTRRVIAFEMPGFGSSPENTRARRMEELAATIGMAATNLGIETFDLMGTALGGTVALWVAVRQQERLRALVLEAPAAILPLVDPAVQAKTRALVGRLRGPARHPELERRMRDLATPTLVLLGTLDQVIPPEMGRFYKALIPNCHLVFVYDAGHEISADRPEAFAEVTADFLERGEAFVVSRAETRIHP